MERILQHYVPNISFDIQSLRKTVEELKTKHRGSDSEGGPSIMLDSEDMEDLAIDDEDFTIKALTDNTTRMFLYLMMAAVVPAEGFRLADCGVVRRVC
jgi:hypothetical protein